MSIHDLEKEPEVTVTLTSGKEPAKYGFHLTDDAVDNAQLLKALFRSVGNVLRSDGVPLDQRVLER